MKSISVNILDPKSVEKAIKQLDEYKKEVETKTRELAQRLTDLGAEVVRMKIVEMGAVDSGELLSSVEGYYSPTLNAGFIRVTSDHVAFVEFGTGIVGQASPHTSGEYLSKASWGYATGSKIFTTQDGRVGWIYPTDDGGFRFTEGMQSRPFMYETALELERQYEKIAREVFAK
ncbi:MAG: HK97 gp10 family phage protein [Clostridia bacterium]|nr:HK97 gp10 family phage protein [Clostridia bacterium]